MFGYCAIGRANIATPPTITIRIAITIATIGLPTKKRDMAQCPPEDEPPDDDAAAAVAPWDAGTVCTSMPGLRRTRSDTIAFSPALTPFSTIHIVPTCSPVLIGRKSTLPSDPTTAT